VARQELLVAVLEQFGLPTPQDLQELAREVTGLKRQVRQLAARLDRLAPAEARHDG
jgi:polyhydroxyalkanoate synthesis regulator phasin